MRLSRILAALLTLVPLYAFASFAGDLATASLREHYRALVEAAEAQRAPDDKG